MLITAALLLISKEPVDKTEVALVASPGANKAVCPALTVREPVFPDPMSVEAF